MASDSSVISISQKRRERKQEGGDKGEGSGGKRDWVSEGRKKEGGRRLHSFTNFKWAVTMAPSVLKTHTWVMSDIGKGELFSSGEFMFLEGGCSVETPLHWHAQRIESVYHCLLWFLNSYQECQGVRTLKQVHHWDLIWGCLPLTGIEYWTSCTDCYLINNVYTICLKLSTGRLLRFWSCKFVFNIQACLRMLLMHC